MYKLNLLNTLLISMLLVFNSCSTEDNEGTEEPPVTIVKSQKTSTEATSAGGNFNVMTFNILWDKVFTGPTQWTHRRTSTVNLINRHNPDILAVQEGFINQAEYIKQNTGLTYFGCGAEDGKTETENPFNNQTINPIFYDAERFTLLERGVFWHSEDSENPNIGYSKNTNNPHYRNCVYGKFQENVEGGAVFYVFNTHLSTDEEPRVKEMNLLQRKIEEIAGTDSKVFLLGDFNSHPALNSYKIITNPVSPMRFIDARTASSTPPKGPNFSGSGLEVNSRTSGILVDHVFARNMKAYLSFQVIDDYEGDYYPSDHFPGIAVISVK